MGKAILFIRVSTEQQNTDSQRESLYHYAMADGYRKEDIILIEKKESGYKLDEAEREGIAELYEVMEKEDISDVYIWELSRLSRRPKDLYSIREKFLERKIQLHCQEPSFTLLNKERTGYDSNANILFSLFGAMAEQEVIEKKARFARGKKRLAEQGRYNGGAIPYGYKKDPSRGNLIVEDEEEGKIVREIFDMYENGFSQMQIAREMFARGVKGRAARRTKNFTLSLVHQILTNRFLTGERHKSKGASYERSYPPLVTKEQFDRCRKIAQKNNRVLPKSLRIYYAHGLIKCTECGRNFVSTGSKGYYHCQDAYNNNKKYEGYEGVPKCPNKLCIANNIMDSLLWAVVIDMEATFIMNKAAQKMSECQKEREILLQKLDAIPALLNDIEVRRDYLLDALAEGMKKEKYHYRKEQLDKEERKIKAQATEYRVQIQHYDTLIDEVQKSLDVDFDFSVDDNIDRFVDRSEEIHRRVASITDDKERYEIIHKHIKKVTVEKTTMIWTFGIAPEGKETHAKKIMIYPYAYNPLEFYFIPFDGKGGTMLRKNAGGGESHYVEALHKEITIPEYSVFHMQYLSRVTDKGKINRRLLEKESKQAALKKELKQMENEGYIPMSEMIIRSGLSKSYLYDAIHVGKMEGKKVAKQWYVKEDDFNAFIRKYNPKPKPTLRKDWDEVQRLRKERLLEAILKEE